jgi:hypothetical protein
MDRRRTMSAESVKQATVAPLKADPTLWAAYCRGKEDQAAVVRRFLQPCTAESPIPETTAADDCIATADGANPATTDTKTS